MGRFRSGLVILGFCLTVAFVGAVNGFFAVAVPAIIVAVGAILLGFGAGTAQAIAMWLFFLGTTMGALVALVFTFIVGVTVGEP